jgi:hypothetical protein
MIFSSTTAPDNTRHSNVVWFSSSNFTYLENYQNAVTTYGDSGLYSKMNSYLSRMFNQTRYSDFYDSATGRGYYMATAADVYASPEGRGQTDIVDSRLNDLTPDSSCRVYVSQLMILNSRARLTDRLVSLKRGGCRVYVTVNEIEADQVRKLKAAGIPVRRNDVHDKSVVVYGKYGSRYLFRVYTGSHNWTYSALHLNDEIFVKMAPESGTVRPVYNAFHKHFMDMYISGTAL